MPTSSMTCSIDSISSIFTSIELEMKCIVGAMMRINGTTISAVVTVKKAEDPSSKKRIAKTRRKIPPNPR
jgi:hypothetical protein